MSKNILSEAQDSFWYKRGQWIEISPFDHADGRELSREAFSAGARWATKTTSELSPHVAKFIDMMTLLGWFDNDSEPATTEVAAEPNSPPAGEGTSRNSEPHLRHDVFTMRSDVSIPPAATWDDA